MHCQTYYLCSPWAVFASIIMRYFFSFLDVIHSKQGCGCLFTSILFNLQFGLLCLSLTRRRNDSSSLEASMLKKTWGKEKHQLIAQFKILWDGLLWFRIGGKLSLTTTFFLPTWMQTWMRHMMGGKFFFCADILNRLSHPPDTRQQIVLCWLQPLQKYHVLQKEATICLTKQLKLSILPLFGPWCNTFTHNFCCCILCSKVGYAMN